MRDTRKVRLLLIIGCVLAVIVAVGGFYTVNALIHSKHELVVPKKESMATTDQIVSSSESLEETHTSSVTEEPKINEFLRDYFTWELTEASVEERATTLKEQLSEPLYQQLAIESDSQALIKAIKKYDQTKEINTSNSTQLLSSQYLSSTIYQDVNQPGSYSIQVKIEQKAPYQTETRPIEKTYRLTMQDETIIQFKDVTKT